MKKHFTAPTIYNSIQKEITLSEMIKKLENGEMIFIKVLNFDNDTPVCYLRIPFNSSNNTIANIRYFCDGLEYGTNRKVERKTYTF